MKKILLLMGGVVALTACSDEVYTDVETTEESMYSTNSFNDLDSGFVGGPGGTKAPGKEYFSPWDIWYNRSHLGQQPVYLFGNGNINGGGEEELAYSPYELHIMPYVGLAYFDENNDGHYTDLYLQLQGAPNNGVVADFNTGNYPNLYDLNNPLGFPQEIGALIKADPIIIQPMQSLRLEDDVEHLPSSGLTYVNGAQIPSVGFTFNNGQVNGFEESLLREYGKVFFYSVEIYENGNLIDTAVLHPDVVTLHDSTGHWVPADDTFNSGGQQMAGYDPATGNAVALFFYHNTTTAPNTFTDWVPSQSSGNHCNSREVVFKVPQSYNTHTVVAGSVTKTLYMGFTMHPFSLWLASSLDLRWI